RKAGLG
ncbi:hypothetical protein LSM04_000605, partial [Trypanosoma melophagium]